MDKPDNLDGWPDPNLYSTARDLYTLAAAVIRDFPEDYARYYAIKDFRYNNITQPNRNRLLWSDPYVDGMKTGNTDAAGYCLIASAKRGPRRLLSVILGAGSDFPVDCLPIESLERIMAWIESYMRRIASP